MSIASYGSYEDVEDVSIGEAKRQFEANLVGLARLTQLVLPRMREQRSNKNEKLTLTFTRL